MEQNNKQYHPVLDDLDENEEENSFFDHAYRQTQRKYESCATGSYTLEEIMASEGSSSLKVLYGNPADDVKTTTQMHVDEVIRALQNPAAEPVKEEEDLTFEEMVRRNEKILAEQNQPYRTPKDPYVSAVINARQGMHTEKIPVICIPNDAICSDASAFIPVEEVMDE